MILLRSKAGSASLQALDAISETPELIWTATMQEELRRSIVELFNQQAESSNQDSFFFQSMVLSPSFHVRYAQLLDEIYIGRVYVRLFLKQPSYKLSNAILFAEKLVEYWEGSFTLQVTDSTSNSSRGGGGGSGT